ncbi:hypothetical protein I5907_08765 [Panacibacter sp. DH6]|uniref:DUF2892 domain-containing protein n=1 Tax=Panacibacter microcysteis TaxID=2793269 RepID=A0A931E6Z8_9BACT|nr:hypothetical protein [Panacibacter microcysteis]MBG9376324.1 hypothetical protein [Panacibacter microcysteis]
MYTILTEWNVMRILRLTIGIMALVQAFTEGSWIMGIAGFFVMIAAIANLGCCGPAGCAVSKQRKQRHINKEGITYEELGK